MKVRTLFAALAVLMLVFSGAAEARKINKSDKKVMRSAMKYIGGIASIVAKDVDTPKVMLKKLKRYVNSNKAALHAAGGKIDAIEKALDADEKPKWKTLVQSQPEMKKLMASLMQFMQKHSSNKALMDEFGEIMKSMDPKKSK